MLNTPGKADSRWGKLRCAQPAQRALFKPAIFRAGIILILVPSFVGTCSLLGLNYNFHFSNRLIRRSQELSEITLLQEEAFSSVVRYAYYVISLGFEGEKQRAERARIERRHLLPTLARLSERTARSTANLSEQAKKLPADIAAAVTSVDNTSRMLAQSSFSNNIQRFKSYIKLMKRGIAVADQVEETAKSQSNAQSDLETERKKIRNTIQNGILAGLLLTLINSVLVLFIFSRRISQRFHRLRLKAAKIAFCEPVTEQLNGDDELSYLSRTFCDVSSSLQKIREENDMLMQMVAHDIRSPIMAMQISVLTFEEATVNLGKGEIARTCREIQTASARVLELVTNFLLLDRLETGHKELDISKFAIEDLVAQDINSAIPEIKKKSLRLEQHLSPALASVDKYLISRVITTYLSSAISSAPHRTTLSVTGAVEGNNFILKVGNQAEPFTAVERKRLYTKFNSEESSGQRADLWLGLPVSKMIIELHQGLVGANSDHNGRTLWFSIPLAVQTTGGLGKTEPVEDDGQGEEDDDEEGDEVANDFDEQEEEETTEVRETPKLRKTSVSAKAGSLTASTKSRRVVDGFPQAPVWQETLRPGLARQGIILAVVPLLLQIVCLGWLNSEITKAEALARRTQQQIDMVNLATQLWLKGLQANANIGFYSISGNPQYKSKAQAKIAEFRNVAPRSFQSGESGEPGEKLWLDTVVFVDSEAKHMEDVLHGTSESRASADLGVIPAFLERAENVIDQLEALIKVEAGRLNQTRDSQESAMLMVQMILPVMIGTTLTLSLLLLWYFIRRTKRRLDRLTSNAARLPKRERLAPLLAGADEMSELDAFLHDAEYYLDQASEQHDSLVAVISDEIRDPLTRIAASIDELESSTQADSRLSQSAITALRRAKNNNARILTMVSELLTIADIEDGKLELDISPLPLKVVFDQATESIASLLAAKNLSLRVSCEELNITVDKGRIVQVLINLLGNAIKFAPPGSAIELQGQKVGKNARLDTQNTIRITVRDSGPGLSPQKAKQIFDKFVKGSSQSEAAFGLGLAICKLIVESHQGWIGVESEEGKGCTFWFELPE